LAWDAEGGQNLLDLGEDGIITAAGAPANFLIAGEVLGGENRQGCGGSSGTHMACSLLCRLRVSVRRAPSATDRKMRTLSRKRPNGHFPSNSLLISSTISCTRNGLPAILLRPWASTRYLARTSRRSWPVFSSGISTFS